MVHITPGMVIICALFSPTGMQALKGDTLFCSLLYPYCCCSVTKSCLTLCDPMNWGTPGFPVLHHLPECAQTRVHWIGDAVNQVIPSCPFLPLASIFPSIKVFSNESVLHIRWQSIGASTSASVILKNIQDWFSLELNGLISLQSKGLLRVFSNTTVQKHQFFGTQLCL